MSEKALLIDVFHMHGMVFRQIAPESCSFNIPDIRAHLHYHPKSHLKKKIL